MIVAYFSPELDANYINHISNLALLDRGTNRSYRNAAFPVKRKKLLISIRMANSFLYAQNMFF